MTKWGAPEENIPNEGKNGKKKRTKKDRWVNDYGTNEAGGDGAKGYASLPCSSVTWCGVPEGGDWDAGSCCAGASGGAGDTSPVSEAVVDKVARYP